MNKNAIGLHKFSRIFSGDDARSSTRPVQIATCKMYCMLPAGRLCLHTPRADCNEERRNAMKYLHLCLHTLRADCNGLSIVRMKLKCTFASTRSVQIATVTASTKLPSVVYFASTRSVQIATSITVGSWEFTGALPPHAPCRLQLDENDMPYEDFTFASTRSVQIATVEFRQQIS